MDFEHAIKARYSCRKFQDREVPRAIIEKILEVSQHTASWNNVQPWRVLIANGEAAKIFSAALLAHVEAGGKPNPDFAFPTDYQGIERERRKTCGLQLYQAVKITREDEAGKRNQMLTTFAFSARPM